MIMIKVGIIGCGSIGVKRHIAEYSKLENVELVAFCDLVKERAEAQQEIYGGKVYEDYTELLADESVEAVSVCTPNYKHAEISIAALEAGKHVLCEKPMGITLDEMDRMIEAEKKSGKQLMVGHNQRLIKEHQVARDYIAEGRLGRIYSFRTAFGHGGPEGWSVDGKDSWFFKKDQAVMGAMGDLGVHKADLIRYILDEEVVDVGGFISKEAKEFSDVDDNAVCILRTESNVIGTLQASWAFYGEEDNSTVIYGDKGVLNLLDDPEYSFIFTSSTGEVVRENYGGIQTNDDEGQSKKSFVMEAFIDALVKDERVPVTAEDAKKSVEIILNAFESDRTNKIITEE
ncbi:Gfo/Idh/MocA family oxidoreductase [Salinicoccus cyprini]|uniref:Gfo/Idh/MocA family oxidoreductase n=1 Tax=Salinicoccus cyprini TaxID=2493691 RepID=A0A558AVA6_9STAP|nr:Gfo/Idh/MocA family oxidoreductase [Salinicoccus cyprini]TVT28189.1 Gfo/Idh/MocA family oxidoreductase [Salinicoccus cyprini]